MIERKKTIPHLQKMGSRCRVVFLRSSIPVWRSERRLPSFRSRWCSWVFSSLLCSVLFLGPPLLEMKFFFENTFPLVSVPLWGGRFVNQVPKRRQKHLSLAMRQSLLLTSKRESGCDTKRGGTLGSPPSQKKFLHVVQCMLLYAALYLGTILLV